MDRALAAKVDVPAGLLTGLILHSSKNPEATGKKLSDAAAKEVTKWVSSDTVQVLDAHTVVCWPEEHAVVCAAD